MEKEKSKKTLDAKCQDGKKLVHIDFEGEEAYKKFEEDRSYKGVMIISCSGRKTCEKTNDEECSAGVFFVKPYRHPAPLRYPGMQY